MLGNSWSAFGRSLIILSSIAANFDGIRSAHAYVNASMSYHPHQADQFNSSNHATANLASRAPSGGNSLCETVPLSFPSNKNNAASPMIVSLNGRDVSLSLKLTWQLALRIPA